MSVRGTGKPFDSSNLPLMHWAGGVPGTFFPVEDLKPGDDKPRAPLQRLLVLIVSRLRHLLKRPVLGSPGSNLAIHVMPGFPW